MIGRVKMKTIKDVTSQFLDAQHKRLKSRTYRDYESVMELFEIYLNGYGPNTLDQAEKERWKQAYQEDEAAFTKLFTIAHVSSHHFEEFLEYFVIRKVASGESFMRDCVRVLKKFSKWLDEHHYIDEQEHSELHNYFKSGKSVSLPNAVKVSDLLYEHSLNNQNNRYEEMLEGYFEITEKKHNHVLLADALSLNEIDGPLMIPQSIVKLCEVGWDFSGVIGKKDGKWYVVEVGNVYP